MNPKCKECQTIDIDHSFKKTFGCLVCNKCKNDLPERYGLLTKTECKEVRSNAVWSLGLSDKIFTGLPIDGLYVLPPNADCAQRVHHTEQRSFAIKKHCLTS